MIVTTFPGRAKDVGVGPDGEVLCVKKRGRRVLSWDDETGRWDAVPGTPTNAYRLAVDMEGTVWVVGQDGSVSRRRDGRWQQVPGPADDIAAAGRSDDVFCVARDGSLAHWDESDGAWSPVDPTPPGDVVAVAAEDADHVWVVLDDDTAHRRHNGGWERIPGGRALDLAVAPGAGDPLAVGSSRRLFDWNERQDTWDLVSEMGRSGSRLAVEPSGDAIVVDTGGRVHRVSTRLAFFNRRIPGELHDLMGSVRRRGQGIRCLAFTVDGSGWVLVTGDNDVHTKGIPDECRNTLEGYVDEGTEVRWVAFPPRGGNSWSIVTEQGFFNRNVPDELHERMGTMHRDDHELRCVAFPPEGGNRWVVVSDRGFFARNIDDECFQVMRNVNVGNRQVHVVAFEPGDGWVILADDHFFARNVDHEAYDRMVRFRRNARDLSLVVFDLDGRGWSIVSNQRRRRVADDPAREFEASVAGVTIWQAMRERNVPGAAVAVVVDNRVAWATGYGHLRRGGSHAVHPETVFQAASAGSKPVTALGALTLVQEGLWNLDDDVTNIIDPDDWAPVRTVQAVLRGARLSTRTDPARCTTADDGGCAGAITVRRLLAHIAGTTVTGFQDLGRPPFPTIDDILNGESTASNGPVQVHATPGTVEDYSGGGYMVLQKAMQEVLGLNDPTGALWANWMRDEVLHPLGMRDSFFSLATPRRYERDHNVAVAHDVSGAPYPIDRYFEPAFAAGGLHSTVLDLARVIIMVNQGGIIDGSRFLSEDLVDELLTRQLPTGRYGLGLVVDPRGRRGDADFDYRHNGTGKGFRSRLVGYPNRDAGVVMLCNRQGGDLRREVTRAAAATYGW